MRNGRLISGRLCRSSVSAGTIGTAAIIKYRMVTVLMRASRSRRQQIADEVRMYRTEKDGKCAVGCTRANTRKKRPSEAAANGTRENVSSFAYKLESAMTRISSVITEASDAPCRRAMKSEAMKVDATASRHGTTLMMERFIVKYRAQTTAIAPRIERGIVRCGSTTSPPMPQIVL